METIRSNKIIIKTRTGRPIITKFPSEKKFPINEITTHEMAENDTTVELVQLLQVQPLNDSGNLIQN